MIRGWYHNWKNKQHLLSIDEIAAACCISPKEVKGWFAAKIQKPEPTGPDLVDAADVVRFLVKNSIPVATSLLPPKTKKLLFIADDEYLFEEKCEKFEQLCRLLANNCNILVETSTAGRLADLSILTFAPNLVVIYLKTYSQETINTCSLLTNFPEQKTILWVDDLIKDVERDPGKILKNHLVVSDSWPLEQLLSHLHMVFDN